MLDRSQFITAIDLVLNRKVSESDLASKFIIEMQAESLKNERLNQARRHQILGEVVSNFV